MFFYRNFGRRLVVTIGLVGILLFTGCSDRYSLAAESAELAEAQFSAGNLDDARESIRAAIEARDDVADYFILLGRIELQAQKYPSAFNAYSRALDLQADSLEVLQAIAEIGLQTDRLREAGEAADRMLLLFPGSTRALLVKGFIAIENRDLSAARQNASDILALDPNDEGGIMLSARVQAMEGDFDGAVATALSARDVLGETEAINATLLEIYRAQGNPGGMRAVFPKVIEASGQSSGYRADFVNLLYKTGDIAAARSEAAKLMATHPNDRGALAALRNLFLEYDPSPLSAAQRAALARSGARATRLEIARFYFESGQYDNAENLLLLPANEGITEAQALIARVKFAEGELRQANTLVENVLGRDPRNPDALVARSEMRLNAGQIEAAIEDANIVVSDAPQEYGGHAALANAQLSKGSERRARQVFEVGIDFLPQSIILAERYEAFLRRIGDRGRVVTLYRDLAAAKPSSLQAWSNYGRVCEEFGDAVCKSDVAHGQERARRSFVIDELPGTPTTRGLFARIAPEQICRSTGGVCTDT